MSTDRDITPAIAATFADILREWLTAEEWDEMRRRNAAETDPSVCHSHDFCDANMAMAEAFDQLGLIVPGQSPDKGDDATATARWNAAWDEAKARHLTA